MYLDRILILLLLLCALWTIVTTRLLRAVLGLAFTSAVLSVIIFHFNSPLAAVFELSVCAGLIPVIFIIAVSFTQRLDKQAFEARKRERLKRYWALPFIIIIAGIFLSRYLIRMPELKVAQGIEGHDVRAMLWNIRQLDLLGQIIVLLAGAFGVAVLFKEGRK